MRVNDWKRVVVRVSDPSAPPDFETGLPGSGSVRTRHVDVGSDLIAELTGSDFSIIRVGSEDGKRTLATGTFAEWQWYVQPLRSGRRELSLVLYVRLTDGGPPVDVKTFVEEVEVQVNPIYIASQWVKSYWAVTGLTVPVIGTAVWTVVAHRRRNAATQATPSSKQANAAPNKANQPRNKKRRRSRSNVRRRHPG